jgi:hypothetical protein
LDGVGIAKELYLARNPRGLIMANREHPFLAVLSKK